MLGTISHFITFAILWENGVYSITFFNTISTCATRRSSHISHLEEGRAITMQWKQFFLQSRVSTASHDIDFELLPSTKMFRGSPSCMRLYSNAWSLCHHCTSSKSPSRSLVNANEKILQSCKQVRSSLYVIDSFELSRTCTLFQVLEKSRYSRLSVNTTMYVSLANEVHTSSPQRR